jgi:hypothetical protein
MRRPIVLSSILTALIGVQLQELGVVAIDAPSVSASSSYSWTLYHAMASPGHEPVFETRGTVTLSVPEGSATVELQLNNDNDTSKTVIDQLKANISTNIASKMYQLKLVADSNDQATTPILTTVPACQVLRANFRCVFLTGLVGSNVTAVDLVSCIVSIS